jgi:AraC-like DNA-binding protein
LANWVSSSALLGAPDLVTDLGGDWDALLAASGLPVDTLPDSDKLIEVKAFAQFLTLAADRLGCESFGLVLSQYQGFSLLGSLASLLGSADNIGELLKNLAAYFPVFTVGALVALVESPEGIEVNYDLASGAGLGHRHITELGFGILVKEIRRHLPDWEPQYVTLRHAPPINPRLHDKLLGPAVYFNADRNSVFVAREELGKSTCAGNAPMHGEFAAQYSAARHAAPGAVAAKVEGLVRAFMPHAPINLSKVATLLRISRRTLQRKLAEDGTSLVKIVDAVRADLALSYLQESRLKVTQIAEILQFSETSALSRAVVRWYGLPPRAIKAGQFLSAEPVSYRSLR